jgi:hypothetical protein
MNMDYDDFDFNPEDNEEMSKQYSLQDALGALPLPASGIVPPQVLLGFSDLDLSDLASLRPVWNKLSDSDRSNIMERIADSGETDYMLDYTAVAYLGYDDPNPVVRLAALRAGATDTTADRLHKLLELAQNDPQELVRAESVGHLGQFIYLGELDELEGLDVQAAIDLALRFWNTPRESLEVRRRALESLAFSSIEGLEAMIDQAYTDPSQMMQISAVVAMGHSCDDVWDKTILAELQSDDPDMLAAAIGAAGMVILPDAVELLGELAYSEDPDIQLSAIWALGEIGGDEAVEVLERLALRAEEEGDDELYEAIEEALANSSLALMMFDMGPEDDDFEGEYGDDDDDDR